jgi:hypothetical protein
MRGHGDYHGGAMEIFLSQTLRLAHIRAGANTFGSAGARVLKEAARVDFDATMEWLAAHPGRLGEEDLMQEFRREAWDSAMSVGDAERRTHAATHAAKMMAARDATMARAPGSRTVRSCQKLRPPFVLCSKQLATALRREVFDPNTGRGCRGWIGARDRFAWRVTAEGRSSVSELRAAFEATRNCGQSGSRLEIPQSWLRSRRGSA